MRMLPPSLPSEVWLRLMKFTSFISLYRLLMTCRRLQREEHPNATACELLRHSIKAGLLSYSCSAPVSLLACRFAFNRRHLCLEILCSYVVPDRMGCSHSLRQMLATIGFGCQRVFILAEESHHVHAVLTSDMFLSSGATPFWWQTQSPQIPNYRCLRELTVLIVLSTSTITGVQLWLLINTLPDTLQVLSLDVTDCAFTTFGNLLRW